MPASTDKEARLEDRIRELEDELDDRKRGSYGDRPRGRRYRDDDRGHRRRRDYMDDLYDTRDDLADVGERKLDEIARIFTGAIRASLEALRVTTDSTRRFADEALERTIPDPDEDPTDVVQRVPRDVTRSWARHLEDKLDAPGRAAERFERAWTRDEGGRRRRRRRSYYYDDDGPDHRFEGASTEELAEELKRRESHAKPAEPPIEAKPTTSSSRTASKSSE
jgi:hypothetical protein